MEALAGTPRSSISVARTHDWPLVKSIVTHPKVYPHISDDFSPRPENWEPLAVDAVWHLLLEDGEEVLGVFILVPESQIMCKVHTCILPNAYGERALRAARAATEWVWANSPCLRVITDVPEFNSLALRFSKAAGMLEYGRNPESFMKRGKLWTQICLGMSKPCPQQ